MSACSRTMFVSAHAPEPEEATLCACPSACINACLNACSNTCLCARLNAGLRRVSRLDYGRDYAILLQRRQPTPLLQAAHTTITGSPHHYYGRDYAILLQRVLSHAVYTLGCFFRKKRTKFAPPLVYALGCKHACVRCVPAGRAGSVRASIKIAMRL